MMKMSRWTASALGFAGAALAPVAVDAQVSPTFFRIWVSESGTDTPTCGRFATPCRQIAYAANLVQTGGEIDVLPGGYAPVTISRSMSVVNHTGGTAGIARNANGDPAIRINNSSAAKIYIRGLTLIGNAPNGGASAAGVLVSSTSGNTSVELDDCIIGNFPAAGINVSVSGATLQTPISVSIKNSTIHDNLFGVYFFPASPAGAGVFIENTTIRGNSQRGVYVFANVQSNTPVPQAPANGSGAKIVISNSSIFNSVYGMSVDFSTTGYLSNSNVFGNLLGLENNGVVNSYGNNKFFENGTDVTGNPMSSKTPL